MGGVGERGRCAGALGDGAGDRQVLGQDPRRGARREIARQRARYAIGEDPARAAARVDHLRRGGRVESQGVGERQRLACRREIGAGEQVVDDLCRGRVAGPLGDDVPARRDRGDDRRQRGERRFGSGQHHRHRSVGGLRRPAGDRRVDDDEAAPGRARDEAAHERRVERRRDEHRRSGAGGGDSVGREQHVVDLAVVDDDDEHHAGVSCDRRGARQHPRADRGRPRVGIRPQVPRDRVEAGPHQRSGHAQTHRAGADDAGAAPDAGVAHRHVGSGAAQRGACGIISGAQSVSDAPVPSRANTRP